MKQLLVDFSDPILSAVLFILLKDRTTGKNIIWATEPPPELGAGFADEITLEQIKKCQPVPRVLKRLDEQKKRTKAKAEVFTPSWVCEKMIDMGEENGAMPDIKKEPIKYIHSTVLEITCGEAPFLVNRYDTVTGKKIPVPRRKGLFDRKLFLSTPSARRATVLWLLQMVRRAGRRVRERPVRTRCRLCVG